MEALRKRYQRFKAWQQQPHQVAPLSEEPHVCTTCGTHFTGNYCPRCGQSATIGRYSFKKAFLLFLDVWGLGNRGMFRTLRDLLLRPGYMIRDYLSGMQMAYFPPFKLLFLLITLSLIVDSGLNIKGVNRIKEAQEQYEQGIDLAEAENMAEMQENKKTRKDELKEKSVEEQSKAAQIDEIGNKVSKGSMVVAKTAFEWVYQHLAIVMLASLLLISGPLYWMFRHNPAIPDIRYSEFFVAMVYTTDMITILSIPISFFCLNPTLELYTYLLAIVPLKQLSGYGYWRTAFKMAVAAVIFLIMAALLLFAAGILVAAYFAFQA